MLRIYGAVNNHPSANLQSLLADKASNFVYLSHIDADR